PRHYINDTGCGNTVNMDHPMVLRMVMDSLRYWVEVMHVDGFRFDLASTLARDDAGFQPISAFFAAIRQDPVLNRVKLIAEPWDI
ncbi:glycogen debranching enzyme, partial [Bacillus sp. NTK074B]|nr:glycogen debranching enzyme [Bacillus sp. NTK074B]